MRKHLYSGITFKVAKHLSEHDADKFCAALLAYQTRPRSEAGAIVAYEVDRMADVQNVPKRRGRPPKVLARTETHKPGETRTVVAESTLYAQGFYREACRTCGKGIQLTGRKGRAPVYHVECRPQ